MRVLFLGLNYAPEEIGIAAYSTGMCEEFARRGHDVTAIVGKPYYPEWSVHPEFRGGGVRRSVENGVTLARVPHYVPAKPTGFKRIVHHFSFALCSLVPTIHAALRERPDIVMTVGPSIIAAPVARIAARISGAKSWLHIQDFEVDAAFATGLVASEGLPARFAHGFERWVLGGFDRVSSISYEMCKKAVQLGVAEDRVLQFRNWAEVETVTPLEKPSSFRDRWRIDTPHVALYAGNIALKQGIDILVETARLLFYRKDLTFVVCGNGPNQKVLRECAAGLSNILFFDLQPKEQLSELMGLATIHLLPQKASAADLVLPSKLTNMLASGRPVVATAHSGTGLAREVEGSGVVVPPGDAKAIAAAIEYLIDSNESHAKYSVAARESALASWNKSKILENVEREMLALVAQEAY
ncbi:MAG: WcaI family glycosyltransferase [Qipengyuania sp.]